MCKRRCTQFLFYPKKIWWISFFGEMRCQAVLDGKKLQYCAQMLCEETSLIIRPSLWCLIQFYLVSETNWLDQIVSTERPGVGTPQKSYLCPCCLCSQGSSSVFASQRLNFFSAQVLPDPLAVLQSLPLLYCLLRVWIETARYKQIFYKIRYANCKI